MKKLHLFIIKSYLGPLLMTFFIAVFILVMQFLWKYVDEMVGKGLEWYVLAELLFYASTQVIPMALPLAILLASLMMFGNLGENYELTAIKAAGISLPRIMLPLVILTILTSIAAFGFSNNVLPVANLKLYSLLYDVKQARPELEIKEKIFYNGIDGFSIKINDKDSEKDLLKGVMIYDHRDRVARNSNVTFADSGKIQISEDKSFIRLTLLNGVRYDEKVTEKNRQSRRRRKQMFRTDVFKEQVAIIDLMGFDFSRTDENMFTHSDRMKNLAQLQQDEDSLKLERIKYIEDINRRSKGFYFTKLNEPPRTTRKKEDQENEEQEEIKTKNLEDYKATNTDSVFNTLDDNQQKAVIESAIRKARNDKKQIESQMKFVEIQEKKIIRHKMQWHRKFTLSFACFIFFFIGAPLGAIIRKGGLGMPVVISILFFIIYYIIDTFGAKLARENVWPVWQGMWLSSSILLPLGIFLTYKSATDSSLMNSDAYFILWKKITSKLSFPKKK